MMKWILVIIAATAISVLYTCKMNEPQAATPEQPTEKSRVLRYKDPNSGKPAELRLFDRVCTDNDTIMRLALRGVTEEDVSKFKASKFFWNDANYEGCWIEIDSTIFNIDSTGAILNDRAGVPARSFIDESI